MFKLLLLFTLLAQYGVLISGFYLSMPDHDARRGYRISGRDQVLSVRKPGISRTALASSSIVTNEQMEEDARFYQSLRWRLYALRLEQSWVMNNGRRIPLILRSAQGGDATTNKCGDENIRDDYWWSISVQPSDLIWMDENDVVIDTDHCEI